MTRFIIYKQSSIIIGSIFILVWINGCENSQIPTNSGGNVEYELCYKKLINDNWEIVLNSLDGNSPINISNNVKEDSDPAWSPDGRYIAFTYFNPIGGGDIYLYDIEKESLINLTPGMDFSARSPLWTPEGRRIVFDFHVLGSSVQTYIMNNDGTNKEKLLDFVTAIYFYEDSNYFIYDNNNLVCKSHLDGNSTEIIVDKTLLSEHENVQIHGFNLKTEELLYSSSAEWGPEITCVIATYNIRTEKIDTLLKSDSGCFYHSFVYSRDYQMIAFIETQYGVWIGKIVIIENGNKQVLVCMENSKEFIDFSPMVFSPGNTYLAFTKNVYNSGIWVSWENYLNILYIDTKEIELIDEAIHPQWNPLLNY